MLCSKILVPYDDSPSAQRALEKALEIAKTDPAIEIHVVHVTTLLEIGQPGMVYSQALVDTIYQNGKDILAKTVPALSKLPNHFQTLLLEGRSPSNVILNYAEDYNCDLIVMGSRGLSGIKEFLGSVSNTIVHRSQIPVLIIK